MIDRDLALLYGVETKRLNEAVRRNKKRFEGDDFMFQLTKDELACISLRSQIATSNNGRGNNVKYQPLKLNNLVLSAQLCKFAEPIIQLFAI